MRAMHRRLWLLILVLAVVLVAGIWVTYTFFTLRYPGGNDFLPRWVGGCALLREGLNPYSDEATERIQMMLLGRLAEQPEDDRGYFAYPLYCILFVWPLCATDDFHLARAVWMWLLLGGLVAAAVVWMRVINWRPTLGLWTTTVVWVVFMYHDFRALVLGQFAVFVLLALVIALWAMRQGRDGWAGLFLVLSTVKPQMVYLAIPWILLWAAGKRRWRLWWGFGVSLALLAAGSMILVPTWIPDSLRQVFGYTSFAPIPALPWLVFDRMLGWGGSVAAAVAILLALGLLTLGWRLWRGSWKQMVWMLGVSLLLTNCFTPRIASTNYLTLVPWVLWGFSWMQRVWGRRGTWVVVALQAVSAIGLWALFLTTIEGNFETGPVFLPFPAAMILLLAWLWKRLRPEEACVPD